VGMGGCVVVCVVCVCVYVCVCLCVCMCLCVCVYVSVGQTNVLWAGPIYNQSIDSLINELLNERRF